MPAGPQVFPVTYANEVNQATQAPTSAYNLGKMIGQVLQWNSDLPTTMVRNWINETYRSLVDMRRWAGLKIRGQIVVPNSYSTGTVTIANGSQNVVGTGTAFTLAMVGQQLRCGFSTGFYNISAFIDPTHITLDLPWGNQSVTNSGFSIMSVWVAPGPNIKKIWQLVNQRQGFRIPTNVPQGFLNQIDAWRTSTGWTTACSPKELTLNGWAQFELWPAPTFQQAFPYLAYIQPPDMMADTDFPYPFIRGDMLVLPAIANALTFRGPKMNKYYDPNTAESKLREFRAKLEGMINADESLDPKDEQYDEWGNMPMAELQSQGAQYWQSHENWPD